MAAVVGVQHHEPGPGQRVLLAGQALAGDVDRRLDVAVVEHDPRERPLPFGRISTPETVSWSLR